MHFYPSAAMNHQKEMKTKIGSLNLLFSCKSQFLSLLALLLAHRHYGLLPLPGNR